MPSKTPKGNRQPTLLLSLPQTLFDEILAVASSNKTNPQELFRRAAVALVRCHHTLGEVPLDMELSQRRIAPAARAALERAISTWLESGAAGALKLSPGFDPSVNESPESLPNLRQGAEALIRKARGELGSKGGSRAVHK